jgi:Zn-dependent protease with chaperone function
MPELELLAGRYARQLGASRPPTVRVIPGYACFYSPLHHCIAMGADVLDRATRATTEAILAHEVGHSVQPDATWVRLRAFALAPGFLLQAVSVLLLLLGLPLAAASGVFLGFGVLCWSMTPRSDSFERFVAREVDADRRGALLLGSARMADALREYLALFESGRQTRSTEIRLRRLCSQVR